MNLLNKFSTSGTNFLSSLQETIIFTSARAMFYAERIVDPCAVGSIAVYKLP